MPAGILIKYSHAPNNPGHWYPCTKAQIRDVIAVHMEHWGREQVTVNGEEVVRAVPLANLVVVFCQGSKKVDGDKGELIAPEPIDVIKLFA